MRYQINLLGIALAVSLCLPVAAFALMVHTQPCNDCHRTAASPRAMTNLCLGINCHSSAAGGAFNLRKGSDALGNHPDHLTPALITGDPGDQSSHFWGGTFTNQLAAGTAPPPTTFYFSKSKVSTNRVTCSICHNPHGEPDTKLLRASTTDDVLCQQCHSGFYQDYGYAWKTHPIGNPLTGTYEAARTAPANAGKFNPTLAPTNPNSFAQYDKGGVSLVNGYVSCSSCHSVHFADSDSATVDGLAAVGALASGDGHLLKADGPFKGDKSALCQTCHTYQEHGKVGNNAAGSGAGDVQIGCLVCHSGHSYDATAPNFFVLRKTVDSGVAGFQGKTTLYTTYPLPAMYSYCSSCHGAIGTYTLRPHSLPADSDCKMCHSHNATAYSFAQGSSGESCTSCHGAPPRADTVANRADNTVPDTGYAIGQNSINYRSANQNGKDESTTPHKRHAGALQSDKVAVDYAFGTGSILNACLPCHNDKEDAVAPVSVTHDETDSNLSFQDVYFNSMATYGGVLTSPVYSGSWTCSGIYCHSNGGKRRTDGGAKQAGDFKTATTPAWGGSAPSTDIVAPFPGTIIDTANECQQCHGENTTTMDSGAPASKKNNSQSHDKHLLKFGDLKTSCYLCHSATVDSSGIIPASARDHRLGGTHVNGTVNVVFSTTALNAELVGGTYPADNSGTCVVYCHSDAIGGPPALVPDWDFATGTIVCGSCHGITAATLTSNSHPIHIDSTKAKIKCSSCHGPNTDTGTHSGHVDGIVTLLTKAVSCNPCHGVELGSGKSWDIEPNWGQNSSVDCRTCHTGAVLTSYVNTASTTIVINAANNLSKTLHESDGHSRSTPFALTGKPAANKNCSACHVTLIDLGTGHVDGIPPSKLLIGGFSCEACHTAAGARSAEATVDVQSHGNQTAGYTKKDQNAYFTKTCLACHDPHGTSNGAMIENLRTKQNSKDATGNYAGNVVFTSLGGAITADSFDEPDGVNTDDLCATCHSTTLHNNQTADGTHSSYEGTNCTTTCHVHNGAKGGFMPTGGNFCNDCHANPPTASDPRPAGSVGAHAAHSKVGSQLPTEEDMTDCGVCHQGGESFALDGAHSSAPLVAAIGYNAGDGTCSGACHLSTAIDGYWNDNNGLDCTSCHNNIVKPLSLTHNKHFAAGKVCIDCHTAPEAADAGAHPNIDEKRTHITDHVLWTLPDNDGIVLDDRAVATQDEATVIVPTWSDGANTCSNAACHNPSGLSNTATWGNTNGVGCNFCHSNTNPDTGKVTPGSHGVHMNAAGTFGITTIACTSCHPNNTLNGHLNSAVDLNIGFVYSASLTDYTPSTYGRCTTTTCHNNGKNVAVQTPVAWGTAYDNCTICHNNGSGAAQPNTGRHNRHVANTSYVASACGNCHANATATTMTNATTHINGTAQTGIDITAHTAGTATCTNNCHLVDVARGDWLDANFLICTDCHGRAGSAGGAYPTSGLHTGTLTVSANTHDNSFQVTKGGASSGTCETCHSGINLAGDLPATHIAGGAPAAAQAALHTNLGYFTGSPATCGPTAGLATCHTDGGNWKRRWSTTATATTGAQCGNCHGTFDLTFVTGVGQRHGSDPQVHGGHNGVDDCYICHTYKSGDTTYYNIANAPTGQHRDNIIQLNNGMLFIDDGATVHCNGCHDAVPLGLADGQYSFQDTNNGDGADGGLNRWGRMEQAGPPANCNGCHAITNGLDHDDPNESASVHTLHTGSPLSPGCGACHANSGPGGANHQNNSLNFGGIYLSLTAYTVTPGVGGVFTNTNCSSANGCHNSILNSWKTPSLGTGTQPCIACHASGKLLDQLAYPPTSNEHSVHTDNDAYVGTTVTNDCDDCHGAGSSTGSHGATHSNGVVNVTNKVNNDYNASLGTCTNSCHNVVDGRDWTSVTTLDCIDCHQFGSSYIGEFNKPVRATPNGLHKATGGPTGALAHDDNFGAGGTCTSCHTAINLTTPPTHVNGTNTDVNTTYGLFTPNYNTGTGTCYAPACHDDGGDWARKWIGVVDAKPLYTDAATAAVCGNCHGSFAQGWRFVNEAGATTTDHTNPETVDNTGDQMNTAGHQVCSKCHGWGVAGYQTGTKHQNNNLTMNSDLGYVDGTGGCNTNCHAGKVLTMQSNSGFIYDSGAYGALSCGSCHADGQLPPTSGSHAAHDVDNDSDYSECEACHGTNNGGDWATGSGGTHNLSGVNFAAGVTYSGGATGTCTTTQCHSAAGNPATWGASIGCNACHYYDTPPTANGNATDANKLSPSHEKHFAKGKACIDCHGTLPTDRNHIAAKTGTDGVVLLARANAARDNADPVSRSGLSWDDGNNTCSGIGLGCHASGTPNWDNPITSCTICHTNETNSLFNPTSGLHNFSTATRHDDTLQTGVCINCHDATSPSDLHQDGIKNTPANAVFTFNATKVLSYSSSAGCAANCHRDHGQWKRKWSGAEDETATGGSGQAVCNNCHGQFGSWKEGTVHYRSGSGAGEDKGTGHTDADPDKCQDCHGYPSVAGRHNTNDKIDFSGNGTAYTLNWGSNGTNPGWFCLSALCHTGDGTQDAAASTTRTFLDSLAFPSPTRATPESIAYVDAPPPTAGCSGCHINPNGEIWPYGPDNGATPNRAGAHVAHVQTIADKMLPVTGPGTGTMAEMNATCVYCHPANTHSGDGTGTDADLSKEDTNNDGNVDINVGSFKKIVSPYAADAPGYFRTGPKTCSDVACHANAVFTPGWYGDTVAPIAIANLTAPADSVDTTQSVSTEPGTVKLTWTAPGDDANLVGTAYIYDVRYRAATDGAITGANWDDVNSKQAGNPPTVDRQSKMQDMIVKGLTPYTSYTFAVKTADERYPDLSAWSGISNVSSIKARKDDVAPVFYGLDMATQGDSADVFLSWDAARDHSHSLTTPITYWIWYSSYSVKNHIDLGRTLPTTVGDTVFDNGTPGNPADDYTIYTRSTTALKYQVTGLPVGITHYFLCRAKDNLGNIDSNSFEMSAMAKSKAVLPTTLTTYYANGPLAGGSYNLTASQTSAIQGSIATSGNMVFSMSTGYGEIKNVTGLSFEIYVGDPAKTTGLSLSYELGTWNGSTFAALGGTAAKSMTIARGSKRIRKMALNSFTGMVASGGRLAVRINNTGSGTLNVWFGNATNKGVLLVNEQKYNTLPSAVTFNPNPPAVKVIPDPRPGVVTVKLGAASSAMDTGQTVHYDIFGSIAGASPVWKYVIARGICYDGTTYDPDCTPATGDENTTGIEWDTIGDGISGNLVNLVSIKVAVGDGYVIGSGAGTNHTETTSSLFSVNNSIDGWPPAAVSTLAAETRPKQGSVNLTWKAVGNDGLNHGSRAAVYDIRYRPTSAGVLNDSSWNDVNTKRADGEPSPNFSGNMERFELLGLAPDTSYSFAMKVSDVAGNVSGISNVVTEVGGSKCGICHATPPNETFAAGKHANHGFTKKECGYCHTTAAENFGVDHQDGVIWFGFKTPTPAVKGGTGYEVTYTQAGTLIYTDNSPGGFNSTTGDTGDMEDNGTCSGFTSLLVSGCHGPATPSWNTTAPALSCSACHGESLRVKGTATEYYNGRDYDTNIRPSSAEAKDQIKASPAKDNRGQSTGRYVGQHVKHINSSFRLSKGDNCRLCHKDNVHYDGLATVSYDVAVVGDASWDVNGDGNPLHNPNGGGTCSGTSEVNCHGDTVAEWHSAATVDCVQCHGFNGTTPSHVTDPAGGYTTPGIGNCTVCHPAGHPLNGDQDPNSFFITNNAAVGIDYRSGGIHLLKNINGRGTKTTQAEICWTCHDANGISEWGNDTGGNNVSGQFNNNYNYGNLFTGLGFSGPTSNWLGAGTGAYWRSGTGVAAIQTLKEGKIQSTHSTHSTGSSAVTYDATNRRFNETPDTLASLRCSNCHDVHNMNKAAGDGAPLSPNGQPYLRGSWRSNPYTEDSPPLSTTTYTAQRIGTATYGYGAVPRGGTLYQQSGGYYIDQNNVNPGTGSSNPNPTSGWTLSNSAGLCSLCHLDVDIMDQTLNENLWMVRGKNGHSNSAIGGTFAAAQISNIFDHGTSSISGRPAFVATQVGDATDKSTQVPDMGYVNQGATYARGYGYRGADSSNYNGVYAPATDPASKGYSYNSYDWGAFVDAGSIDTMYHQFSCSKCHNPHASRLPKLLITNCLDVQHNTWDDNKTLQNSYTAAANNDQGKRSAYYNSAQNCHRYQDFTGRTATTISFTSPNLINDSGSLFTTANGFRLGSRIHVKGSAGNDGMYTISGLLNNRITVSESTITTAGTGPSITVRPTWGGWNMVTPWTTANK